LRFSTILSNSPRRTEKAAEHAMNNKQNRAQKRAIIEASVKERTHRAIRVKMPIALADRLKADAKENNKIFTGYVLEKIEQGLEASRD
jgi:hypothetical protein